MTDGSWPEHWRLGLLGLWLGALATVTLSPVPLAPGAEPMSRYCLVCGDRGTADAIMNLLLFAPLGVVFARGRHAPFVALAAGGALSAAIELAQLMIPGRYPTLGDVLWNGAGAAVGTLAVRALARHKEAPSLAAGRALAGLVGISLAGAGWILGHAATNAQYYGQWTPDLGHMPEYEGTLISATLDGLIVPDSGFAPEIRAAERFSGNWTLVARIRKGPVPASVSPIVSVYDADQAEILVLGADGEDLVLRERTRAKAVLLDQPDLRLADALSPTLVDDTLTIGARRLGHERCMVVGGVEACGLGFTPGRTWGLLVYPEGMPESGRRLVDTMWLVALLVPVGMLSSSRRALLVNGLLVAMLAAAGIWLTRLVLPPVWEVLGGLAGLQLGRLASHRASDAGAVSSAER